ncbi:four helix bundle protein [bacterium]|nr:four helix bundle protein [bacterium]RQV98262.1 MAG: four helix bundle protein [bacterium]
MKIERFEELECWQQARALVKMVYQVIHESSTLSADYRFAGQLSSAAVSVMSNVAEGFSKETDKEFLRGLWIAKGSAAEVQSLSYAAIDLEYISDITQQTIYKQAENVCKLISGMIRYLQKSNTSK